MRVIATADGHDGKRYRPAGEEFDVSDKFRELVERAAKEPGKGHRVPSWFVPVEQGRLSRAQREQAARAAEQLEQAEGARRAAVNAALKSGATKEQADAAGQVAFDEANLM